MMRHAPLPAPGKGIPARHRAPSVRAATPGHPTRNTPTANTSRTRPTFVLLLIKDPDTVTTTGRRQSAGHNGV